MPLPAFTLLDPAAAITAAAVGVPALLFLYFLKLRRRPVRVSSTLLWTQAVQDLQVNAPFRWIRPTWLLLLQLLGLACLITAVGRPALDSGAGGGKRLIVIVDHSASMAARDAGVAAPTRLELAKERAKEIVERSVGRGDARAMVVASSGEPVSLSGLTGDRGLLRQAIDSIEATDQPGDLRAALRLAETVASQERGENDTGPFRVVLLSDGGSGGENSTAIEGLEGAALEFVRIGPAPDAPRNNTGIVSLNVRRDYDDPTLARAFVRVLSTLNDPTDIALRLTLDGQTIDTGVVRVPAATVGTPATGVRTFSFTSAAGGACVVELVRDDALAADNAAASILASSSALRIALVRRGQPDVAASALEQALTSLDPFELRVLPADAAEAALAGVDLIVFDRVAPLSLPGVPTLSFGAPLPVAGISADARAAGDDGIAFWERVHPVMRYVSLASVRLSPGTRVRVDDRALGSAGVRSQVLASGISGPLLTLLEQGLSRRIVVGFSLADTNWWRSDSFPIFVANAVDFLTRRGDEGGGEQFSTVQPVRIGAPSGTAAELTGADGFRRAAVADADGVAVFGVVPRVGLYSVHAGDQTEMVAVNLLDEGESAIATRSDAVIAGKSIAGSPKASGPRELWAWFACAGLALLTIEWLLFAWRMRV